MSVVLRASLSLLLLLAGARAELLLVKDHQPQGVIIAGADASAALAARDLKEHLDRIAGCDFPLVSADEAARLPESKLRLLIGEGPLTAELKITSQDLEPEAYRIVTQPNALVIVGRNVQKGDGAIATSPAVLYGTSHLLRSISRRALALARRVGDDHSKVRRHSPAGDRCHRPAAA